MANVSVNKSNKFRAKAGSKCNTRQRRLDNRSTLSLRVDRLSGAFFIGKIAIQKWC